jgi:hypothetical protein
MGDVGAIVVGFVIYLLLGLLPVFGVLYVIYFLVTLPLRRNERVPGEILFHLKN